MRHIAPRGISIRAAIILGALCLALLCLTATASADTLNLPEDLTIIDAEAFMGASSLVNVVIPEGVTAIGERA